MSNYYLVTIKTRGERFTHPSELMEYWKKAKREFRNTEWSDLRVMEYPDTPTGRLHLHTIAIVKRGYYYTKHLKKLNTNRVYMHFKEFKSCDYDKVRQYILKQVPDYNVQTSILKLNFLENINCFCKKPDQTTLFIKNITSLWNYHPIKT